VRQTCHNLHFLTAPRRLRPRGTRSHEPVNLHCRCRNMGKSMPGEHDPRQEGMQAALVAPQAPHAAPLLRRMAPQPPLHRRLRRMTRMPPKNAHRQEERPEAGFAPQGPSRTRRLQMRPSRLSGAAALSCRRPQDAHRPVSLVHAGTVCGHPPSSSPGRRPGFSVNPRRRLRPSSRGPLSARTAACVRALN
jgi:hypothetical protein